MPDAGAIMPLAFPACKVKVSIHLGFMKAGWTPGTVENVLQSKKASLALSKVLRTSLDSSPQRR